MQVSECPFCGKIDPVNVLFQSEIEGVEACPAFMAVVCDRREGGCGGVGPYKLTSEEAEIAWNTRGGKECPRTI